MINVELNLGKVALAISANIKTSELEFFQAKGIASEGYRATASKVFGPKGHPRDEAFSEQLASEVKAACMKVLSPKCESLTIETSAKKEGIKKPTVESVLADLGLSMDEVKGLAILKREAAEKAAAKQDEQEEVSM